MNYIGNYSGDCSACGTWHAMNVKPASAFGTTENYRLYLALNCANCGLPMTLTLMEES